MENKEHLETSAANFRCVSFVALDEGIAFTISVPLVGNNFEYGAKMIGETLPPDETFLGIPFVEFVSAGRGTIAFNGEGQAKIRVLSLDRRP